MSIKLFELINKLGIQLTEEQKTTVNTHRYKMELYKNIKQFYLYKKTKKLTPNIAAACAYTLIQDKPYSSYTAIIICHLVEAGALSTMQQTLAESDHDRQVNLSDDCDQIPLAYLKRINAWRYEYRPGLLCALRLIHTLFDASELAKAYINDLLGEQRVLCHTNSSQLSANSSKISSRLNQIRDYLVKIAITDDLSLIWGLTTLTTLAGDSELFFDLANQIGEHNDMNDLQEALDVLAWNTVIYEPRSMLTHFCLNAVLHDQQTPKATANILNYLFYNDIGPSVELARSYCDKVTAYPAAKKISIKFLADILASGIGHYKWPLERIKACILMMLHNQEPLHEMSDYMDQFLNSINQIDLIVNEGLYQQLEPQAIIDRLGACSILTQFFSDRSLCFDVTELKQSIGTISNFYSKQPPQPSLSSDCALQTSNHFFSHPKKLPGIEELQGKNNPVIPSTPH